LADYSVAAGGHSCPNIAASLKVQSAWQRFSILGVNQTKQEK
jgi:hypothetical protein